MGFLYPFTLVGALSINSRGSATAVEVALACKRPDGSRVLLRVGGLRARATFSFGSCTRPEAERLLSALRTRSTLDAAASEACRDFREGGAGLRAYSAEDVLFGAEVVEFRSTDQYYPSTSFGVRAEFRHFKLLGALERALGRSLGHRVQTHDATRSEDDFVFGALFESHRPCSWWLVDESLCGHVREGDLGRRCVSGLEELRVDMSMSPLAIDSSPASPPPPPPYVVGGFDIETVQREASWDATTDLVTLVCWRRYLVDEGGARLLDERSLVLVPPPGDPHGPPAPQPGWPKLEEAGLGGRWPSFEPWDALREGVRPEASPGAPSLVSRFETESALVRASLLVIRECDDFVGHNSVGYDMRALCDKAELYGIDPDLGWLRNKRFRMRKLKASDSKQKGFMEKYRIDGFDGRNVRDTMLLMLRENPTGLLSFGLEAVAQFVLKDDTVGKDPVKYSLIPPMTRTVEGRLALVKYCAQDVKLCADVYLTKKFHESIEANCRLTGVSPKAVTERGNTCFLRAAIAPKARPRGYLFPSPPYQSESERAELAAASGEDEDEDEEGPKSGGFVRQPHAGRYEMPAAVLDFASLYPSIIRRYNVCFSTVGTAGTFRAQGLAEGVDFDVYPRHHTVYHWSAAKQFDAIQPPMRYPFDDTHYERLGGVTEGDAFEVWRERSTDASFAILRASVVRGVLPDIATETLALRKSYRKTQPALRARATRLRVDADTVVHAGRWGDACRQACRDEADRLLQRDAVLEKNQLSAKELCNSLFGMFGCRGAPTANTAVADVIPLIGAFLNMVMTLRVVERGWASQELDMLRHPTTLVVDLFPNHDMDAAEIVSGLCDSTQRRVSWTCNGGLLTVHVCAHDADAAERALATWRAMGRATRLRGSASESAAAAAVPPSARAVMCAVASVREARRGPPWLDTRGIAALPAEARSRALHALPADFFQVYDGNRVVYGDTDSIFVTTATKSGASRQVTPQEHSLVCAAITHHLNTVLFEKPIELEFEDNYFPLVLTFNKKHYAALVCDVLTCLPVDARGRVGADVKAKAKFKGMSIVKRSTAGVSKALQRELYEIMLRDPSGPKERLARAYAVVRDKLLRIEMDLSPPSHYFRTAKLSRAPEASPGGLTRYFESPLNAPDVSGLTYEAENEALRLLKLWWRRGRKDVPLNSRVTYYVANGYQPGNRLVEHVAHADELSTRRPSAQYYAYNVLYGEIERILGILGATPEELHAFMYHDAARPGKRGKGMNSVTGKSKLRDSLLPALLRLENTPAGAIQAASLLKKAFEARPRPAELVQALKTLKMCDKKATTMRAGAPDPGHAVRALEAACKQVEACADHPKSTMVKRSPRWIGRGGAAACGASREQLQAVETGALEGVVQEYANTCRNCRRATLGAAAPPADIEEAASVCQNDACHTWHDRAWAKRREEACGGVHVRPKRATLLGFFGEDAQKVKRT